MAKPNALKDYEISRVKQQVNEHVDNYIGMNNFPMSKVAAKELQMDLLGPDLADAISTIRATDKRMLNFRSTFEVLLSDTNQACKLSMYDGEYDFITTSDLSVPLDHQWFQPLMDWCIEDRQRRADCDVLLHAVNKLFNYCNTAGQVERVWPNLLPMLGGRAARIVSNQVRKTRYPYDLDEGTMTKMVEEAEEMLGKAMLAPEAPQQAMSISIYWR